MVLQGPEPKTVSEEVSRASMVILEVLQIIVIIWPRGKGR